MSKNKLSRTLGIGRTTIDTYCKEFKRIELKFPGRASNIDYHFRKKPKFVPEDPRYKEMMTIISSLLTTTVYKRIHASTVYADYHRLCPNGYKLGGFTPIFRRWRRENHICPFAHNRVRSIPKEDAAILQRWRTGTDLEKWRKAVVITGSHQQIPLVQLAAKVEVTIKSLQNWVQNYRERGIAGLIKRLPNTDHLERIREEKTKNVMRLLHETPKLHGFNRTTWKLMDLSTAYYNYYGAPISRTAVGVIIRANGFKFRQAKTMLTSPDPNFREKLNVIKGILSQLKDNEKFFSIDELGPCSIKIKGGQSYMKPDHLKIVPQVQKIKGWLICTAAIELSTNQVTHFYSVKKDSEEMIKLINVLLLQYHDQQTLYLSWDAVSWHISKQVTAHVKKINEKAIANHFKSPSLVLATLPASAQFLNVIESIFSGLAKSILHNSDYASTDECKQAIDLYFEERNDHFKKNPKKAGKMIWGKELVKPAFDETQNCKDPKMTR